MRNINKSADTARSGLNVADSRKRGLRSSRNTVAKLIRAIVRWLVRQSPFLGYPHEVTIERPAQTMNRHKRECQEYLRMMERQRRYRIDIDGLDE